MNHPVQHGSCDAAYIKNKNVPPAGQSERARGQTFAGFTGEQPRTGFIRGGLRVIISPNALKPLSTLEQMRIIRMLPDPGFKQSPFEKEKGRGIFGT